jgi:hypothetical protein
VVIDDFGRSTTVLRVEPIYAGQHSVQTMVLWEQEVGGSNPLAPTVRASVQVTVLARTL